MIDIEKLADEFFEFPDENNKQYVTFFSAKLFAEAYHKAMCEQSEPVAFIDVTNRKLKWAVPTSFDTLSTVAVYDDIPLYTTPQPLKRLSEDEVLKLLNVKNDSPNVLVYLGIANAIIEEMERINK